MVRETNVKFVGSQIFYFDPGLIHILFSSFVPILRLFPIRACDLKCDRLESRPVTEGNMIQEVTSLA